MDEATVRAMLEQHFASSDPDRAHEMYHDDAVLEFPQSAERFVGVENFRESRSAMTRVLGASGSASSSFEGTRSRVTRSTSPRLGATRVAGSMEVRAIGRYLAAR